MKNTSSPQRGFSLIMTLMILLILTTSALAMLLVMRGGTNTAANIAFRQAATRVADIGVASAFTYLNGQTVSYLKDDHTVDGYYANNDPTFSPGGFDFTGSGKYLGTDYSGYKIYYVVHRMAMTSGVPCSDPTAGCIFPPAASSTGVQAGQSHAGGTGSGQQISGITGLVYYRVTVKVIGPRFNNRYVQAFLY